MRKFTSIILIILVLVAGGVAIYIGLRLQGTNVAPKDTSAAIPGQYYSGCLEAPQSGCPDSTVIDVEKLKWNYCAAGLNPCQANTGWDTFCDCNPIGGLSIGCPTGVIGEPDIQTPIDVTQIYVNPNPQNASNCTNACGQACTDSNQCGTGYECSGGTCKNSGCLLYPEICQADGCTPTAPQCNEPCYGGSAAWHSCPSGQVCTDLDANYVGVCRLAGCIQYPELCDTTGCGPVTPQCGDQCYGGTAQWADCPTGTSCVNQDANFVGVCADDACITNPAACDATMCPISATVTPTPTSILTPTTSPSVTPTVFYTIQATDTPTPTPTFTVTTTPTNTPTGTLSPTPTPTRTSTPTPTPTRTNTPTPSATTTVPPLDLLECYETGCSTGGTCIPGLQCQNNRCVNPQYPNSSDCKPQASYTPVPTTTIPATALISDTADRILIGAVTILTGLWAYLTGFYKTIGLLLWDKGAGKYLRSKTIFEKDALESITKKSGKNK